MMKRFWILFVLLLAGGVFAQNFAVRFLWQDPANEFHSPAGCPTNWPVAVDGIGTNTVSPWANRAVLNAGALSNLYATVGPTFTNWYVNTRKPALDSADRTQMLARSNNVEVLKGLYQDMATYEQRWQAGLSATTTVQINAVLRTHNDALLRLRPLLIELYRGD